MYYTVQGYGGDGNTVTQYYYYDINIKKTVECTFNGSGVLNLVRDFEDENKLYLVDYANGTVYHSNADFSGAEVFYKSKTGHVGIDSIYI